LELIYLAKTSMLFTSKCLNPGHKLCSFDTLVSLLLTADVFFVGNLAESSWRLSLSPRMDWMTMMMMSMMKLVVMMRMLMRNPLGMRMGVRMMTPRQMVKQGVMTMMMMRMRMVVMTMTTSRLPRRRSDLVASYIVFG
jgi:hypothetical protein